MTDPLSTLMALLPGLAKAGVDLASASDQAKRNAQLIEFQNVIIQAQSTIAAVQNENAALLRDKHQLEEEIVRMKNWEGEQKRYALVSLWDGVASAYAIKKSMSDGQPPHYLCPNCFTQSKKSFLNSFESPRTTHGTTKALACAVCSTKLHYSYHGSLPSAEYAPE